MKKQTEKIEEAIELLREAMRADAMIFEAAHFWVSEGAFHEIKTIANDRISKAFSALLAIPADGKVDRWRYGHFPPLHGSDVPASLMHICIHEAAEGKFKRPAPFRDVAEEDELTKYFETPSEAQVEEYNFRDWFANTMDEINFWSMS